MSTLMNFVLCYNWLAVLLFTMLLLPVAAHLEGNRRFGVPIHIVDIVETLVLTQINHVSICFARNANGIIQYITEGTM